MIALRAFLSPLLALALLTRRLARDGRRVGTTMDSRSDDGEAGRAQG